MLLIRKMYLRLTEMTWIALTIATVVNTCFLTTMMRVVEPETFDSYFHAFWFAMTTMLTVGYGDLYPQTDLGKLIVIVFGYLIGIALITTWIAKIFDAFMVMRKKKERGEIVYEGKNHVVIIDWSHKAENAIRRILRDSNKTEIVVIDNLEKAPYLTDRIHYVKGDASNDAVLHLANVKKAKAVMIFADDNIHSQFLTDAKSLMIATAVERVAPDVTTVVEIELEEHIPNFNHVNVNQFVLSNNTISNLAVDAIS
jgi:voltage-gated potassium channel